MPEQQQLEINLQAPARHLPRAQGQRPPRCRPRRERPVRPHAAADALALEHMDLAEKIAGNFARRTVHPKEDLLQLAMIGLIKAARRYDPSRGPFRPYGRTYANGEITHFLRDNGFLLKVPPTWRELHARGQRLLTSGVGVDGDAGANRRSAASSGFRSSMPAQCGWLLFLLSNAAITWPWRACVTNAPQSDSADQGGSGEWLCWTKPLRGIPDRSRGKAQTWVLMPRITLPMIRTRAQRGRATRA